MYLDPRFRHWRNQHFKNSAESIWKIREFLAPVTTRSGPTISGPVQPRFEGKREEDPPSDTIKNTIAMAALNEEDPKIGSFNAHLNVNRRVPLLFQPGKPESRRPAGSTEEDYRLRTLPFALKGEADTWFMRLPPNSIRTWGDFRAVFLEYLFPATRTNALKKEIQGATQEDDDTLSQY
ncbi:hypothetical protein AAHA92_33958 [Salvia divinorum]|uniref:Retrotransposon gag domain-containing protein n=1 Tax=Salvia divinorum TaxID=28513 RepID=A0ABD1FID5_SALDI